MKTIFSIIAFILVITSCGSRKVESDKQDRKIQNTVIQEQKGELNKTIFRVVRDTVFIEKTVAIKSELKQDKHIQKKQKKREYYDNGALKSEVEISITETEKINQLTEELQKITTQSKTLKQENEKLLQRELTYQNKITELHEKINLKKTYRDDDFLIIGLGVVLLSGLSFIGVYILYIEKYREQAKEELKNDEKK